MDNNRLAIDSGELLLTLLRRWKLLLAVALLAMGITVAKAWREPVRYAASATLVPSNDAQLAKSLFSNDFHEGVSIFGIKREVEQLMELMSSQSLIYLVAEQVDLWNLWGIDSTAPTARAQLRATYGGCVSVRPTPYQGVQIEATDVQPERAALLANAVAACADTLMRRLRQQVAQQALAAFERHYCAEQAHLNALADSLRQANAMRQPERALRYSHELQHGVQNLVMLGNQRGVLRVEAEQAIPWLYVLDRAVVPDTPVRQHGVRFVVVWTLAALLLAACAVLVWDWLAAVARGAKRAH